MQRTETDKQQRRWWKEATVYQIYPASFCDANNDGIGDLRGIISKLDHVKALGIDVIWISPHYASPQVDMGYDISDYNDVHRPYGTMKDCKDLIAEIHSRNMRVIFDLVVNHTSDQHQWFQASRSSKSDPQRDWYIWRPARYDEAGVRHPPNNWKSYFTDSAWTWDELTQEYYLHLFASEQPDLNWENKDCREAIYNSAVRFWLDEGIDGFRVDTANIFSKSYVYNPETKIWDLPNTSSGSPNGSNQFAPELFCNGPRMEEYLQELNDVFGSHDIMTVGELQFTADPAQVSRYVSAANRCLNMVFSFEAIQIGQTPGAIFDQAPFTPDDFKRELTRWQNLVDGSDTWVTVFLENHDHPRSISRFGSDSLEDWERSGKMLATILSSMTGTLFLYQGQEIGMINAPRTWSAEEYKDIMTVNYYKDKLIKCKGDDSAMSQVLDNMRLMARDHARTPMQWDDSPNAGFCGPQTTPWMRTVESKDYINVKDQSNRNGSLLEYWKMLLKLRKENLDTFVYGTFRMIEQGAGLLVFTKTSGDRQSLTVANLTNERHGWAMPADINPDLRLLISNVGSDEQFLEPFEARIYVSA